MSSCIIIPLLQQFDELRGVAVSVVDNQLSSRGRFVTRKAFENSELINDTHFAGGTIDIRSIPGRATELYISLNL